MKTAIISGLFTPFAVGGAEAVARREALDAKARGEDVFVITTAPWAGLRSLAPQKEVRDGLRVYRFFPLNFCHVLTMMRLPFVLRAVWRLLDIVNLHSYFTLRKILAAEKPDRVFLHNVNGLGYLTWRAIAAEKVSCVFRLHDLQLIEPFGTILFGHEEKIDNCFHRAYQWITRTLAGSPQKVVSPSRFALDMHLGKGFFLKSEISVAPNPLPAMRTHPRSEGGPGVLRLLYVGGIEKFKGIVFLVETLKKITGKKFVLQIAGSGSQLETIKRMVSGDDRFIVRGRIEGAELEKLFYESDCLVIPSLCYENAPTVIAMARTAGLRVAASRIGGIPEMVDVPDLFTPGDPAALLRLLKLVPDD